MVYDYSKANEKGLNEFINHFDFENTVFSLPVEEQADKFSSILHEAFLSFVPSKTVLIRPKEQNWSNSFTRLLLRKKNRNYQLYKKANSKYMHAQNNLNLDYEVISRLKKARDKALTKSQTSANQSTTANRRTKTNFFNSVNSTMKNVEISAKKKFNILTQLMKNGKFSKTPPLVEGEEIVNDPMTKSNLFNKFFTTKSQVPNPEDIPPHLDPIEGITPLDCISTSPIEISKVIRDNLKKSLFSNCGIPGKFPGLIATPISRPMTTLFNNIFQEGYFPDSWKISHVTPIYKRSGAKCDKSNFRPISLLPTISKLCESIIHHRLLEHCMKNSIISEKQAAYLKGDSTINQLLYLINKIRVTWGNNKILQGLFLDISAAFDKIRHPNEIFFFFSYIVFKTIQFGK